MKSFSNSVLLVFLLFCFGCYRLDNAERSEDAVRVTKDYASASGMSLSGYEIHSVKEYSDGKNGKIDLNRTDDYAVNFFGKLRKRNYWEVCYRTVEQMLGGEQCYYVDKNSKEVLTAYLAQ